MECQNVEELLNALSDGERLAGPRAYAAVAGHSLRCAGCRAVWHRLRQTRRLARQLPSPPVSPALRERVLASLPAPAPLPVATAHGGKRLLPRLARLALGVALVGAGVILIPWRKDQPVGAAVEAAVQRANTWHLKGWKMWGGRRLPWEIWGQRTPFFYREQLGEELNFDDGKQRVRVVATGPAGSLFALRLASGPAPSDQWREWLTMGRGWRGSPLWRETPDAVIWQGHDSGMQGPGSGADSVITVSKQSWLPTHYEYREYREGSKANSRVTETLQAEYDVPLPSPVTRLQLPRGVLLADTLSEPTDPGIPTENVQRARGLTVQVTPLAMDAEGHILVRVRSWLGNLRLGGSGSPTWNDVETNIRYRSDEARETAYHTDDGCAYVELGFPTVPTDPSVADRLLYLVPLEPRPRGMALPRRITLNLEVTPQVMTRVSSSVLFHQEFVWVLALPDRPTTIDVDAFLPPGYRQRHMASVPPLPAGIAQARAWEYGILGNRDRALYWQRQSVAAVRPYSNDAQFRRLGLAHEYQQAGDLERAAAVYREVITISQQHPETSSHYAASARAGLEYLRHPRKPHR